MIVKAFIRNEFGREIGKADGITVTFDESSGVIYMQTEVEKTARHISSLEGKILVILEDKPQFKPQLIAKDSRSKK